MNALRFLLGRRLITSGMDMAQRVGAKTEKIVSLNVPAEEAMAFAQKKSRGAPLQNPCWSCSAPSEAARVRRSAI